MFRIFKIDFSLVCVQSFVDPICENLNRLRNFPGFGISRTDLYLIAFVTRMMGTGGNGKRK